MTPNISPPRKPMNDPDAQIDCELAIDVPVRDLVDAIIQAGWAPEIAYAALKSVAENQALAYMEDPDPAADPE
ncbi:hypothetical protein [Shinella sp. M31]|uniref:hypothetical protein n=1 Tax=Shinella sp. M31 TaxID=3368615 RepID=UPI003BA036E1